MRNDARIRLAGLLAAGSLAVHQIRYAVGYGGDSSRALAEQGHGYLGAAGALAALLLAVALGAFLGSLLRGRGAGSRRPGFRALWLASTAALAAIYSAQEMVEAALAPGHPAGLAAVIGHGGAAAFAAAAVVGALIAVVMRGAHAALDAPASGRALAAPRTPRAFVLLPLAPVARPAASFAVAPPARGPPLLSR